MDTLALEKLFDRRAEPWIGEIMCAVGRRSIEAPDLLVLSPRPGFEAREAVLDAVLDRGVITDVEMEMSDFSDRAPIASVEDVALLNVECAGDLLPALFCDDENQSIAKAFDEEFECLAIQVLTSPGTRPDGREIERIHRVDQIGRNVIASEGLDDDFLESHFSPLPSNLISSLAAKCPEVVLEVSIAVVVPVVLQPNSSVEPDPTQGFGFVGEAEIDVDTRQIVARADFAKGAAQFLDPGPSIDVGMDEKLWQGMAEMGLAGLHLPEEYGGGGLEVLDLAIVSEAQGYMACPGPFLGHALAGLELDGGIATTTVRFACLRYLFATRSISSVVTSIYLSISSLISDNPP